MVSMHNEPFTDATLWSTACKLSFSVLLHISNDLQLKHYSQKERNSTIVPYEVNA